MSLDSKRPEEVKDSEYYLSRASEYFNAASACLGLSVYIGFITFGTKDASLPTNASEFLIYTYAMAHTVATMAPPVMLGISAKFASLGFSNLTKASIVSRQEPINPVTGTTAKSILTP